MASSSSSARQMAASFSRPVKAGDAVRPSKCGTCWRCVRARSSHRAMPLYGWSDSAEDAWWHSSMITRSTASSATIRCVRVLRNTCAQGVREGVIGARARMPAES